MADGSYEELCHISKNRHREKVILAFEEGKLRNYYCIIYYYLLSKYRLMANNDVKGTNTTPVVSKSSSFGLFS